MTVGEAETSAIDVVLIVGGKYHDFDFARLELLKLLAQAADVRTRVFEDYSNVAALAEAQVLVTYTCDVRPTGSEAQALMEFVRRGGRWCALHGTNALLEFLPSGLVDTPDAAPLFTEALGSRFLAHPPIGPYRVEVVAPAHPLVAGISDFETTDELYLSAWRNDLEILLEAEFEGETPGFTHDRWPRARHPVLYLRRLGAGEVIYFTLGHCRGHHDMRPLRAHWPTVDRCSWELPVFFELLQRILARALGSARQEQRQHA